MKVNVYFSFSLFGRIKGVGFMSGMQYFQVVSFVLVFNGGVFLLGGFTRNSVHSPATSSPLAPINFLQSDPPVISP